MREKCQLEAESRQRAGNSSCWGRAGQRGITETSANTGGLCTYPIPGYQPLPGIQVSWEELVSQYSPTYGEWRPVNMDMNMNQRGESRK